jgi:hypothetical protein
MSTPIIDYAAPVPRSRMRLPARSEIRWAQEPGRLVITQVLAGRAGAIAALLLAGFTFVLMSVSVAGMIGRWHRNVGLLGILGFLMTAEIVVGLLVIHNTWRRTVLTVTRDELAVETAAPFTKRQRFVFGSEQVAAVIVVDSEPTPGQSIVPELEIRLWSIPPVRLFAGHLRRTLMSIAAAIGQVQPMQPPPLPSAAAGGTQPVSPIPTDVVGGGP